MKPACRQQGFTLLEIMVAISIAALLMAVSIPSANRLYASMSYRSSVGEVKSLLENARFRARTDGQPVDVWVRPRTRELGLGDKRPEVLASTIEMDVVSAAELTRDGDTAVIRFYPDGSSSGGRISLRRGDSGGVALEVGWLLGEVSQHPLAGDET